MERERQKQKYCTQKSHILYIFSKILGNLMTFFLRNKILSKFSSQSSKFSYKLESQNKIFMILPKQCPVCLKKMNYKRFIVLKDI